MNIKKYIPALIFGIYVLTLSSKIFAVDKVNLYLFWGEGCPHCAKEKTFLTKLAQNDESVVLYDFEVYKDLVGRAKLLEAARILNIEVSGVPLLVIGDEYIVGYGNDETTGKEILKIIEKNKNNGCFDIFANNNEEVVDDPVEDLDNTKEDNTTLIEENSDTNENSNEPTEVKEEQNNKDECIPTEEPAKISLPKFGNIKLENLSLPALTVVLGFLDGFNPCAMWVLLFLISLLIGMKDRKKMWVLGIAFIVSSAFVYFLFMIAWLNLFQFVGFILWVRTLIAGIAFLGGYVSLKKFFSKDSSGCDVEGSDKKRKIFEKLGDITSNKSFFLALIGIIGLAFAINLVELVCSAGLPAVYTQVLSLNKMSGSSYYLYILLYILFFMLDDLFVFFIAMTTLKMTGVTTKYVKYTRLVGGVLMLIIGILLLFKPEILMFG